jgi:thiol-disulfide isomerase/thioredoxin
VKRLIPAAIVLLLLSGCAADPLAELYQSGSNQNYISGDGTLTLIAPEDRGDPIVFESETDTGAAVSSDDYLGEVVVINFWYAACPPCRVEAPDLEALHQKFDGEGASFLGVNVRDQAETAAGFEKEFGITYPSVIDANNGNMLLAFAGTVAPNAVPTTLVLDAQGRVAARFLGLISEPTTLKTIIAETIAEAD